MEKGKIVKRILTVALAAAVFLLPSLLYFYLLNRGVQGALMYGGISFLPVAIVSVFGGAGVLLLFGGPSSSVGMQDDEDYGDYELPELGDTAPCEDVSFAREEYPELFLERDMPGPEQTTATPSYYEALADALKAQKTVAEAESDDKKDEDDALSAFLSIDEKEAERESDILSDIPDTLPEGYVAYEEAEEEEEYDGFHESESEGKKPVSPAFSVAKRVVSAALLTALPIGLAVVLSFFRTEYFANGVAVSGLFGELEYRWSDCIGYEISPAFFGDSLSVVLHMEDGTKVELLPSDGRLLDGDFDNSYEYAVYVAERLDSLGVEKRVLEKNTLEGNLALREDIGEYVQKLID